jgi:hypothetical protein
LAGAAPDNGFIGRTKSISSLITISSGEGEAGGANHLAANFG